MLLLGVLLALISSPLTLSTSKTTAQEPSTTDLLLHRCQSLSNEDTPSSSPPHTCTVSHNTSLDLSRQDRTSDESETVTITCDRDAGPYLFLDLSNLTMCTLNTSEPENDQDPSLSKPTSTVPTIPLATNTTCPLGLLYNHTSDTCQCYIRELFPQVECEGDDGSVTFPRDMWVGFLPVRGQGRGGGVFARQKCVFDYCDRNVTRIFLDRPDEQCRNNRTGVLCGQCPEGFSRMLGSTGCRSCDSHGLALLLVFALLGVLLIVTVTVFDLTITHGYVNGFIFYSNVLALYLNDTIVIPPSGLTGNFSRLVFSLINLNFGIEVCFFEGARDLHLALLCLVFPLYLGGILVGITLFLKYCHASRLGRLLGRVNVTHAFATLLLLSYSSVIRTCIDLLSFLDIYTASPLPSSPLLQRGSFRTWRVDPNQAYFAGLHVFGVLVAVFFIVILLPFPLLLLSPSLSLRLPLVKRLKPLIDAFIAPLDCPGGGMISWVGVRLLCRILLFMSILLGERRRSVALCAFMILLTVLQAYLRPFRTVGRNLLDLQVMLNLTVISFLAVVVQLNPRASLIRDVAFVLLISVAIEAVLLFLLHILMAFPHTRKLLALVRSKSASHWSKIQHALKRCDVSLEAANQCEERTWSCRSSRDRNQVVTHTSLDMTNLPPPSPQQGRDRDFSAVTFVGYRESLLETENAGNVPAQK